MYGWLWRHIPFKQWQLKALVSVVLLGAAGALLWYQVFPAVEPILPFDDVQVQTTDPAADNGIESPPPSVAPQRSGAQPSVTPPSGAPTTGKPQVLPS